jgi:hypothetical protein
MFHILFLQNLSLYVPVVTCHIFFPRNILTIFILLFGANAALLDLNQYDTSVSVGPHVPHNFYFVDLFSLCSSFAVKDYHV